MQTFLPYPNFINTAEILDYRRLGKQRIEAKQILQILLNETDKKGWRNHPAVLMWRGYEPALAYYGYVICMEWIRRGYKDTQLPYFKSKMSTKKIFDMPPWWGNEEFHRAHRSNLVRKDEKYYRQYFSDVSPDLPYIWPTKELDYERQTDVSRHRRHLVNVDK